MQSGSSPVWILDGACSWICSQTFPPSTGKSNLFWWLLPAGGIMLVDYFNCMRQSIVSGSELHHYKWLATTKLTQVLEWSLVSRLSSFCHSMLQVGCFLMLPLAVTRNKICRSRLTSVFQLPTEVKSDYTTPGNTHYQVFKQVMGLHK